MRNLRQLCHTRRIRLSSFAVALVLVGCTVLPPLPAPVEKPPLIGLTEAQQQVVPAGTALGVGDVLRISVYDNPDLSQEVTIESEGAFQYPLIGRIQARGLTVSELETLLTKRLAAGYLVSPQVGVAVVQRKSQQVSVIGAVKAPGVYPLQRQTTLLELLSLAGGPTPEAGFEAIVVRATEAQALTSGVTRGAKTTQEHGFIRVQLEQLLSGAVSQRIVLTDGDVVYVPTGAFFYITGEVQRPGRYRLERDTTILKAVTLAGGFTKFAATNTMVIQRAIDGQRHDFQAGPSDTPGDGDVIIIRASLF